MKDVLHLIPRSVRGGSARTRTRRKRVDWRLLEGDVVCVLE